MIRGLRKISRVRGRTGGTTWYLTDDCLLAAKRVMYTVEYRRFYLRDLESIVVWPSRLWLWRVIIPAVLLAALGASLWKWVDSTAGAIFTGGGIAWVLLEMVLGPTAASRVGTTGAIVDLPLVKRTRRASKVLEKIDAAVRAAREVAAHPNIDMPTPHPAGGSFPAKSETAPGGPLIADASQTHGF